MNTNESTTKITRFFSDEGFNQEQFDFLGSHGIHLTNDETILSHGQDLDGNDRTPEEYKQIRYGVGKEFAAIAGTRDRRVNAISLNILADAAGDLRFGQIEVTHISMPGGKLKNVETGEVFTFENGAFSNGLVIGDLERNRDGEKYQTIQGVAVVRHNQQEYLLVSGYNHKLGKTIVGEYYINIEEHRSDFSDAVWTTAKRGAKVQTTGVTRYFTDNNRWNIISGNIGRCRALPEYAQRAVQAEIREDYDKAAGGGKSAQSSVEKWLDDKLAADSRFLLDGQQVPGTIFGSLRACALKLAVGGVHLYNPSTWAVDWLYNNIVARELKHAEGISQGEALQIVLGKRDLEDVLIARAEREAVTA